MDFDGLLLQKSSELDVWIKKMQQAKTYTYPVYVPITLYKQISETVKEAFEKDFNLIIEEFGFY